MTVTAAVKVLDPSMVTESGEMEHVAARGAPEQLSETTWLNEFSGVKLMVNLADWPEAMLVEVGNDVSLKSETRTVRDICVL